MKIRKVYDYLNRKFSILAKPFPIISAIVGGVVGIVNYLTPDPFEELAKQMESYQNSVSQLEIVAIPDSMVSNEIDSIRIIQQKLLAYVRIINACEADEVINGTDANLQLHKMWLTNQADSQINEIMLQYCKHAIENDNTKAIMAMISTDLYKFKESHDKFVALLASTSKAIGSGKEDPVDCINSLSTSNEFSNYLKESNNFVRQTFEYLNVVQLSYAYGIKFDDVKNQDMQPQNQLPSIPILQNIQKQ